MSVRVGGEFQAVLSTPTLPGPSWAEHICPWAFSPSASPDFSRDGPTRMHHTLLILSLRTDFLRLGFGKSLSPCSLCGLNGHMIYTKCTIQWLNRFTMLHNQHLYLVPNIFIIPKVNPVSMSSHFSLSSPSSPRKPPIFCRSL